MDCWKPFRGEHTDNGCSTSFWVGLILGNVLAVILASVESIGKRYESLFFGFEVLSVAVFTLELSLRFWISDLSAEGGAKRPRWRCWVSPYTLTDVLAIAPFYLGFFFSLDLRLLRLLRLFRLFRISPYFRSLALLGSVIRQEYRPMLSALAVISILMLFAAGAIYLLERDGQPESFGDLPSALWWVIVTLSTVGYGDAVPLTVLGRILGAVIMVLGVGMVALPAGMLASRFSEVMHRQRDLFRRFCGGRHRSRRRGSAGARGAAQAGAVHQPGRGAVHHRQLRRGGPEPAELLPELRRQIARPSIEVKAIGLPFHQ